MRESPADSFDISGLRLPASASCLGRHSYLAGRGPNSNSLFPPLAAVVAVALRLQGSGQGTFKKSFLPDLCLFYVEIEKPAIRDRKHDHQFCNQRLIVILTQSFGNYNKSRPAVIPGGGGRCTLLRAKQKIFTECRCTHRPAPCSCCARRRTCRTCCRCRCGRPPAGGHRG